ncbi:hypothetical protein ACTWQF_18060 [Streptomyces sp. 8N114]
MPVKRVEEGRGDLSEGSRSVRYAAATARNLLDDQIEQSAKSE